MSSPTPTHATGTGLVPLSSIIIPDRQRTDDLSIRAKIEATLVPSIQEHGLIHPILVSKLDECTVGRDINGAVINSDLVLIAGWSRLTAFKLLGYESIPYNTRSSIPVHERAALELEENIRRNDMSWQDIVCAIASTHQLKLAAAADEQVSWGMRQMGVLIGQSAGYTSEAILISKFVRAKDPEVCACASLNDARKVLAKRKETEIADELAKRHRASQVKTKKKLVDSGIAKNVEKPVGYNSALPSALGQAEETETTVVLDLLSPTSSTAEPVQITQIDVSSRFFNGDSLYPVNSTPSLFRRFPDSFFDLIYTDIPYGIDMVNLNTMEHIDTVEAAHDVDENVSQMPRFLSEAYRTLKPDSYLLFWYDLKHHEKLHSWATQLGFSTMPYPLIWHKSHACRTRSPQCWWAKDIEYVFVARKGNATLSQHQQSSVFKCSGIAERKLQTNPFSKPFEFSKWLLDPIIKPGYKALDCYAGEGSLVRAMLNLGCDVYAFEKEPTHYNKLMEHVKAYYSNITNGKVEFV